MVATGCGGETLRTGAMVTLGWIAGLAAVSVLLGGRHYGDDAVVLITFALVHGAGRRAAVGLLTVLLFAVSFPPLAWPLYGICCTPMVWLWRESDPPGRAWVGEAFGVGFAMCWLTSPFIRADFGRWGVAVQALASAAFALQVVGIAGGLRLTRRLPIGLAAPLVAAVATALDIARVFGLRWPLLVLAAPAAPTPLAQWASVVGIFGVSFFLYTINFLAFPGRPAGAGRGARWVSLLVAGVAVALAWLGGEWIATHARSESVPFAALLVQPNRVVLLGKGEAAENRATFDALDTLTREALSAGSPVDLIVWPEAALHEAGEQLALAPMTERPDLDGLYHHRMPLYQTPCLIGATVRGRGGRLYNSACLVTPEGTMSRYDKRMLVIDAEADFTPGGPYQSLEFRDHEGRRVRIGVAICYEMHFPGLPQYRGERPDAIVHLNNESWYRRYPGMHLYGTWACQYRAIETRTWQLVCATWTRSAAIDPRGRIRALLPAQPAVLRVSPDEPNGRANPPGAGVRPRTTSPP